MPTLAVTGQQVTLTQTNAAAASARIHLLVERGLVQSPIRECDLVVKGVITGEARGWLMQQDGEFQSDKSLEPTLSRSELEALIDTAEESLTFTCVPWGSGVRIGIDRDLDGVLDGDQP